MIEMIVTNIPYIVIIFITSLIALIYRGGLKNYAKHLLLCLVNTAEQSYGKGCGKFKYSAVAVKLYEMMPRVFRVFFSEGAISAMIESAVDEMKSVLSSINARDEGEVCVDE